MSRVVPAFAVVAAVVQGRRPVFRWLVLRRRLPVWPGLERGVAAPRALVKLWALFVSVAPQVVAPLALAAVFLVEAARVRAERFVALLLLVPRQRLQVSRVVLVVLAA